MLTSQVLIISYETQRRYSSMFKPSKLTTMKGSGCCCDLLICDEAHKLKNAESGLAKSLRELPAKKRVLLSGTFVRGGGCTHQNLWKSSPDQGDFSKGFSSKMRVLLC